MDKAVGSLPISINGVDGDPMSVEAGLDDARERAPGRVAPTPSVPLRTTTRRSRPRPDPLARVFVLVLVVTIAQEESRPRMESRDFSAHGRHAWGFWPTVVLNEPRR
jgi:hypothetical protein